MYDIEHDGTLPSGVHVGYPAVRSQLQISGNSQGIILIL